jgi:hypothetical protein
MAIFLTNWCCTKQALKTIIANTFKGIIDAGSIFTIWIWNTIFTSRSCEAWMTGTDSRGAARSMSTRTTFGLNEK